MAKRDLEQKFLEGWTSYSPYGLAGLSRQYLFHPVRRWKLDFGWPKVRVGVEIDGYGPGHTNAASRRNDCEKQNALILLNWRILRFTANHLTQARIEETISQVVDLIYWSSNGFPSQTILTRLSHTRD